jgi:hypothetical protein
MAGEFDYVEDLEVSQVIELVFNFDTKFQMTELVLKGPQIPKIEVSPTITMSMKNGKVLIKTGIGENQVELMTLPSEMRAYFGGRSVSGRVGPQPVPMPNKSQLVSNNGGYISYSTYRLRVFSNGFSEKNRGYTDKTNHKYHIRDFWTPLPQIVYDTLVKFYKIQDLTKYGPLYL